MKAAVFSCLGLGDCLVSLTLSHNLYLNGYEVDTFHDQLTQMQKWFLKLPIKKYPKVFEIESIVKKYDKIFISYDAKSEFIKRLIETAKDYKPQDVFVLNPCPSKKVGTQPFYKDTFFSPKINVVENILKFCKNILHLKNIEKSNGIKCFENLEHKKFSKRIIIHPSSAKVSKNWPLVKYINLAKFLKRKNFDPIFVVSQKEKNEFLEIENNGLSLKTFENLDDLASFIYQSGFMIGNDSGIGHLASSLGLDTITIFRNHRSAMLWRPGFTNSKVVYPSRLIPNFSFYRLRDKHWKSFVRECKLMKYF